MFARCLSAHAADLNFCSTMTTEPLHPAAREIETLLTDCDIRRSRRSGPGGQHRNKVETAITIVHRPSGVSADASERRSRAENRAQAVRRLRVNLALDVRTLRGRTAGPSALWTSRPSRRQVRRRPLTRRLPGAIGRGPRFRRRASIRSQRSRRNARLHHVTAGQIPEARAQGNRPSQRTTRAARKSRTEVTSWSQMQNRLPLIPHPSSFRPLPSKLSPRNPATGCATKGTGSEAESDDRCLQAGREMPVPLCRRNDVAAHSQRGTATLGRRRGAVAMTNRQVVVGCVLARTSCSGCKQVGREVPVPLCRRNDVAAHSQRGTATLGRRRGAVAMTNRRSALSASTQTEPRPSGSGDVAGGWLPRTSRHDLPSHLLRWRFGLVFSASSHQPDAPASASSHQPESRRVRRVTKMRTGLT